MRRQRVRPTHHRERGQTLVLVAISLVSLLAMGALAVDLATLYSARSEMQRAADAAALAGAQAFVASGVTTDAATDTNYGNLKTLAQNLANGYIAALPAQNTVGGAPPVPTITFDFTRPGNPQITVKMQRVDLPTFFSRIFGRTFATVSATAVAEAYNSSNPGGASNMPPVAPTCVKPWLIPNLDPDHANAAFVNPDGTIANPGVWDPAAPGTCGPPGTGGIIGECVLLPPALSIPALITAPGYLPAALTATPSGTCPSCATGNNFQQSVACCDTANATQYSCPSTTLLNVGSLVNLVTNTLDGAACLLTGAAGGGGSILGPDTLEVGNFQTSGGADPMIIRSGTGAHFGQNVTTSGQIVTVPIINTTLLGLQAQTIGYMQAFVQGVGTTPVPGTLTLYVLNVSGCGSNIQTGATPVSGGGVSPVPVRLIQAP